MRRRAARTRDAPEPPRRIPNACRSSSDTVALAANAGSAQRQRMTRAALVTGRHTRAAAFRARTRGGSQHQRHGDRGGQHLSAGRDLRVAAISGPTHLGQAGEPPNAARRARASGADPVCASSVGRAANGAPRRARARLSGDKGIEVWSSRRGRQAGGRRSKTPTPSSGVGKATTLRRQARRSSHGVEAHLGLQRRAHDGGRAAGGTAARRLAGGQHGQRLQRNGGKHILGR